MALHMRRTTFSPVPWQADKGCMGQFIPTTQHLLPARSKFRPERFTQWLTYYPA
jgi:hypothetical protein